MEIDTRDVLDEQMLLASSHEDAVQIFGWRPLVDRRKHKALHKSYLVGHTQQYYSTQVAYERTLYTDA